MKRSRSVRLALMASGAFALTACDDTPAEPQVAAEMYRSVEHCIQDGTFAEEACRESFEEALGEHAQAAPRYDSRELCEEEFGENACEMEQAATGSFWRPFLAGYVVSELVDEIGDAARRRARGRLHATPIYYATGSNRGYYTPQGAPVRTDAQGVSLPRRALEAAPPPATVQTRTTVVSRGGFGSRMGGFGG